MHQTLKDFSNSINKTPQVEKALGKNQFKSRSGGYLFHLDPWDALDRFLILGSNGTYYASGRTLTKEAASSIITLLHEDGTRVVNRIAQISDSGRAPRNDPRAWIPT